MQTHYTSDVLFEGSYYVASVVGGETMRESVYFSDVRQAHTFRRLLKREYPNEVLIVVDTMSEE